MCLGPRVLVEMEDGADEHAPRARQHHHERPDPVPLAGAGVDPLAREAVVDLGFLTRLDIVAQDGDLRPSRFLGQCGVHPAAEGGDRNVQLVLVPQPLVDRGDRDRSEQVLDVVAVLVDLRPDDLAQAGVDTSSGNQSLISLGPVGLAHRRPARGDPGRLRRRRVLPDGLAVHPSDAAGSVFERPTYQWT